MLGSCLFIGIVVSEIFPGGIRDELRMKNE